MLEMMELMQVNVADLLILILKLILLAFIMIICTSPVEEIDDDLLLFDIEIDIKDDIKILLYNI